MLHGYPTVGPLGTQFSDVKIACHGPVLQSTHDRGIVRGPTTTVVRLAVVQLLCGAF